MTDVEETASCYASGLTNARYLDDGQIERQLPDSRLSTRGLTRDMQGKQILGVRHPRCVHCPANRRFSVTDVLKCLQRIA